MTQITAHSSLREFVSSDDESRAFGQLRRRILATLFHQAISQSRFRVGLVLVLTALLWGGMFWMFYDAFLFLQSAITHPETFMRTVGAVFGTFFAALMLMLVFSAGIILYSSLFCSREVMFLLTTPARTERIFLYKFEEAIVLSSWGFVLLGSPLLLAYGVVAGAPWYYYVLLLPYLVSFIYIPVSVGAIICLLLVHRVPDSRLAVFVGGILLLLAGAAWMAWSILSGPHNDLLTPGWFQEVLTRLQFSEQRLLPSWWLSSGLLSASIGTADTWSESVLFLTLMISNALFFRQVALWTAAWGYRASFSELYGRTLRRKRPRPARFDRLFGWMTRFILPRAVRLLILKDLRIFRRDPMQWSQFVIFLGLLALYFVNVRRLSYDNPHTVWVNMVSFLNLSVVGLLLSTFTTRFIFPMISLEGRRFWVLGLAPIRRDEIIWSKFLFATGGSLIPCTTLVLLSDMMLNVSRLVLISHQVTCVVLCLGLSGIAVGLGARLPNLREQSPSRIAAGFGGTLNLVLSTLYILFMVLLTALPTHFYLVAQYDGMTADVEQQAIVRWWVGIWLVAGTAASFVLGGAATYIPMRLGFRAFRKMEF